MPDANKWDKELLALCLHTSNRWSKDPDRAVGAILARRVNRDLVFGYNGFPARLKDTNTRLKDRELKRKLTIHAELNAILTAKRDLTDYTLYSSLKPCIACAGAIIQADISTVVYPVLTEEDLRNHLTYIEGWALVDEMFEEAQVTVREIAL